MCRIKQTARKVLVSLGGSDPRNHSLKVIQALQETALPELEITVIAGANNPHTGELEKAANTSNVPVRIVCDTQNMFKMMAGADIAVSSGGTTVWELAFTGVPTILIIQAENQRMPAEALHRGGEALYLGWADKISIKKLAREFERFLTDKRTRREMSFSLQTLVDGEGSSRLIMHIKNEKLRLRRTFKKDCKLIWEWANDQAVREASFSSEPIPWEAHLQWFTGKQKDPRCFHFMALDEHDIPVGQIRFDIQGEEAEVSVSIDKQRRGYAYGSTLIKTAVKKILLLNQVKIIHAYVKPDNGASIEAFKKAGFQELPYVMKQSQPARHFIREKNNGY